MFRLIEPSSGQISKHSIGAFSERTHYGIPYCLQNYFDIKDRVLSY
jgi:hypothetical protein